MHRLPLNRGLGRKLAAVGAVAVMAASLSACGSKSTSSTSSGSAGSSSDSALKAEVATLTKPLDKYPVPTTAVSGVDKLKGKVVYYIPLTQQSPQFAVTQQALTAAVKAAGMSIQVCDGKGTPTDVSACITSAVNAKAGAIVTDAVPWEMASAAYSAAKKAGISIAITDQIADPAIPTGAKVALIKAPGSDMQSALMKWIALDSKGKAKILINQSADGAATIQYVKDGNATLKSVCPGCSTVINKVTSSNFSLIPASTSSALLKNPNVDYVVSQFEQYLQVTQSGVQQANATSRVKGVTGAAQLGGLKALKAKNFLYAAGAQASAYQGWVDADAVIRMMLGQTVPTYTIPVRLFTRDTIDNVTLTAEAQNSGAWFGPTTFTDDFKKLWGLS